MSAEDDTPGATPGSDDAEKKPGPAPGWKEEDVTTTVDDAEPIPILGDAIAQASHTWLRDRFGLVEDPQGALHVPDAARWPDLGQRADQFVRGFFRGFVEKSPEEREARYGLRSADDVPAPSELVGRLLTRFSHTVTDTWNDYIAEHAERTTEDGEKVVDGAFVVEHGAGLIGTLLSRLGEAFEDVGLPGGTSIHEGHYDPPTDESSHDAPEGDAVPEANATGGEATPTRAPDEAAADQADGADATGDTAPDGPKVRYEVDLGSIFRALFSPRS